MFLPLTHRFEFGPPFLSFGPNSLLLRLRREPVGLQTSRVLQEGWREDPPREASTKQVVQARDPPASGMASPLLPLGHRHAPYKAGRFPPFLPCGHAGGAVSQPTGASLTVDGCENLQAPGQVPWARHSLGWGKPGVGASMAHQDDQRHLALVPIPSASHHWSWGETEWVTANPVHKHCSDPACVASLTQGDLVRSPDCWVGQQLH